MVRTGQGVKREKVFQEPMKGSETASGDWRRKALGRMRALIKEADPEVIEERKWKKKSNPDGVPVWSHDGIICTGETYKNHLRFTFAKGSFLQDPKGLFNANLEGKTRAIVINEGEEIDEYAFKGVIRAAVELNASSGKKAPKRKVSH